MSVELHWQRFVEFASHRRHPQGSQHLVSFKRRHRTEQERCKMCSYNFSLATLLTNHRTTSTVLCHTIALVRVDQEQSDRFRTSALQALGDLTLNIGCSASTAATCPSLSVRSPIRSSHVQPKHVHLQLSQRHPQLLHFLPFVDQCPRWLCLMLVFWIQLQLALTYCNLRSMGRLDPQLSIGVASQHAPQSHVKVSHQLPAVQRPPRLAVATSSSSVSHVTLRPSPDKSCIRRVLE